MTRNDLDDALGLETVDGPPNRGSAHPELATERLDADLAAGTVTIIVKEKGHVQMRRRRY